MPGISSLVLSASVLGAAIATLGAATDFASPRNRPAQEIVARAFAAVPPTTSAGSAEFARGLQRGRGDRLSVAADTAGARWITVEQRTGADTSAIARVRLADARR